MGDVSGGELNFGSREELKAWLKTQPHGVSVVIAARAALRVAPALHRQSMRIEPRHFAKERFATFWASALARVAGRYPTRANDLRAFSDDAAFANNADFAAAVAADADMAPVTPFVFAFADAAAAAAAATAFAATATATATAAVTAVGFASATARAATAFADSWQAVAVDARRLANVPPEKLASEKLWLEGAPQWSLEDWRLMRAALAAPHWRPWLDWYQRRLDGVEAPEEIELLFATLPVDPRKKDVAEQNEALAKKIARLEDQALFDEVTRQRSSGPINEEMHLLDDPHWDFFISYSTKDEEGAKEISAILEQAGYSTFVQFKDFAPGNNFVREMMRGLEAVGGNSRMIALYSEDYQNSDHCQNEWAAAYNLDPSSKKRKLIPLLLHPTALNPLARQIVFKSLVGLSGEARRKAILDAAAPIKTAPLSLSEARQKLADTASPQPVLNDAGQLDIAPNAHVDRPHVDAALVELPYNLRSLIRTLMATLPKNAPAILRVCLGEYDAELIARGAQPYMRILRDHASAIAKECGVDADFMHSPGVADLVQSFLKRHEEFSTHFPLEVENIYAELTVDETAATGSALTQPIANLAEKIQDAREADIVSENASRFVLNAEQFAKDIAPLPPDLAAMEPGARQVSLKKRYVLGTFAFMVATYNFLGSTASIMATPQGQAVYEALGQAIAAFIKFIN